MKNIKFLIYTILALSITVSCIDDDNDELTGDAIMGGIMIDIKSDSEGKFLGTPESGVDLEDASVSISEASLHLVINETSGSFDDVEKLEVVKSFNGGEEIPIAETSSLPYTVDLSSIDDFLSGTGIAESDLRIGDQLSLIIKVYKTDGNVLYYTSSIGTFNLTLNCSYDLAGTYTMSNTICDNPQTVTISLNADGTWYASTADGGLLQFCTSNTSLQNDGNFSVICEGIVPPSDDVAYCPDFGIGCITGGSWDQENGILILEHNDDYFDNGAYTSTYVRQ
ncbi:hypothetical protein [Sinomicrobium weinanense]|uniref:Uncharacterized protein n=1 Tax=Sinomicrobium weinanense TaxID=2842200 RepID=A0A926JUU8_9FLAO|nr:hypothetical protein [Sinomicrobium weinanense]MBC9797637.1 hypothetical protein [Sinomicrobium weinanense]MBU3125257.1 hypothetical protein [Sinomicrobium weinanense]